MARRAQELQQYYEQLFTRRDTLALPLFQSRMGFDLAWLKERCCRVAAKVAKDPELIRRAMLYLRVTGEVLCHEVSSVSTLRDRVFLEPQRLVDVMKELVRPPLLLALSYAFVHYRGSR